MVELDLMARDGSVDPSLNFDRDLVIWNDKNQKLWKQKLTTFKKVAGKADDIPTLYEMMLLQEDLWVIEAIFNIVAEVNDGIEDNDLANIKTIDHLLIGREAWLDAEAIKLSPINVMQVKEIEKKAEETGAPADFGEMKVGEARGGGPGAQEGGAASKPGTFNWSDKSPGNARYASLDFKPVSRQDLQDGVMKTTLSDLAYLTVAKRIPIRLGVVMNEKKVGEFLAACANADLPFEVRQVRVNRHTPGDGTFGGTAGGGGGGEMERPEDGGGGMQRPEDGGGGAGAGVDGGAGPGVDGGGGGPGGDSDTVEAGDSVVNTRTDYDISVEFYGIVKIYNPVNYEMLGMSKPAEPAAGDAPAKDGDSDSEGTEGQQPGDQNQDPTQDAQATDEQGTDDQDTDDQAGDDDDQNTQPPGQDDASSPDGQP